MSRQKIFNTKRRETGQSLQNAHLQFVGRNELLARQMLKHLARMRPMNRAVICPVTSGRLVHEADFARALMLWQRRKFEAITLDGETQAHGGRLKMIQYAHSSDECHHQKHSWSRLSNLAWHSISKNSTASKTAR
jgi:hypothetical protein